MSFRYRLAFPVGVVYSAAALRTRYHEEIIPIILAAGSSEHLGYPKPLACFGARTALQIAVANCQQLGRPVIVLGCDAAKIRRAIPAGVTFVVNHRWRRGQLGSLLCALARIPAKAHFMLYPVDHPLLEQGTIDALARAFHRRSAAQEIAMPRHQGRFGHPLIVSATLRREFFSAETAREIVYRDLARNLVLQVSTSSIYEDFNTPSSYRTCLRKFLAVSD